MIDIKRKGNFYYVEDNDCYIFYYLFRYRLKNKKCFFRRKYLNKILFTLVSKNISFKVKSNVCMRDDNYFYYLKLGKEKLVFDESLEILRSILLSKIEDKNFNKIYKRVMNVINE